MDACSGSGPGGVKGRNNFTDSNEEESELYIHPLSVNNISLINRIKKRKMKKMRARGAERLLSRSHLSRCSSLISQVEEEKTHNERH